MTGLDPIAWTFSGDGQLDTAPLVIGDNVWVGSASGELYAVDGVTGHELWSTNVGSAIFAPNEQDAGAPAGLGAGDNSLLVSAGTSPVAYAASGVVTSPAPGASSSGQPVARGTAPASTGSSAVAAQAAALRRAISKRATVRRVLAQHGVTITIKASSPGRVVVEWFLAPRGARRSVLLAVGRLSFRRAVSRSLKLRLTPRGERVLARSRGSANILALASSCPQTVKRSWPRCGSGLEANPQGPDGPSWPQGRRAQRGP